MNLNARSFPFKTELKNNSCRYIVFWIWLFTAAICYFSLTNKAIAQSPAIDDFSPNADGEVHAGIPQSHGKILVGGNFRTLAGNVYGSSTSAPAALRNNGAFIDNSFQPQVNSSIHCMAVQIDGKILLGGGFSVVNGQLRTNIARLNPDGTLDLGFLAEVNAPVVDLALQPDGKILIAGGFTALSGLPCNAVGRLHPDGTVDSTFNILSNASDYGVSAFCLGLQKDGKVVVAGEFKSIAGQLKESIARLNPDGTIDPGFKPVLAPFRPGTWASVYALGIENDGQMLLGGSFGYLGGYRREGIGRLSVSGGVSLTFSPRVRGQMDGFPIPDQEPPIQGWWQPGVNSLAVP